MSKVNKTEVALSNQFTVYRDMYSKNFKYNHAINSIFSFTQVSVKVIALVSR